MCIPPNVLGAHSPRHQVYYESSKFFKYTHGQYSVKHMYLSGTLQGRMDTQKTCVIIRLDYEFEIYLGTNFDLMLLMH